MRVLVVDENDDSASAMARLLERCGHDVHVAHSGEMALQQAQRLKPNCLLIDVAAPAFDGMFLAQRFRRAPELSALPLIAVTDITDEARLSRAAASGFDDFLPKPCSQAELSAVLARVGSRIDSSLDRVRTARDRAALTQATNNASRQGLDGYWQSRKSARDSTAARVLLVGSDQDVSQRVSAWAAGAGLNVRRFDGPEALLAELDGQIATGRRCIVFDATGCDDALAVVAGLASHRPAVPIIALVAQGDVRSAVDLLRGGATDVVETTKVPQELDQALADAFDGSNGETAGLNSLGAMTLTDDERRLLELTLSGALNKQIAREMGVSLRTVHFRRAALMKKFGARTRTDLIRLAVQGGLTQAR